MTTTSSTNGISRKDYVFSITIIGLFFFIFLLTLSALFFNAPSLLAAFSPRPELFAIFVAAHCKIKFHQLLNLLCFAFHLPLFTFLFQKPPPSPLSNIYRCIFYKCSVRPNSITWESEYDNYQ